MSASNTPQRFQQGGPPGPGRPKGSRAKLGESFLAAMLADFEADGTAAIAAARAADPAAYIRVLASILPKEISGPDGAAIPVEATIARERIASRLAGLAGPGTPGGDPR